MGRLLDYFQAKLRRFRTPASVIARCPVCGQSFVLPPGSTTGRCPNCFIEWPLTQVTPDTAWLTANVVALAKAVADDKTFESLPILADALEEAGCTDIALLRHCRETDSHWPDHCWVIDLLLDRPEQCWSFFDQKM